MDYPPAASQRDKKRDLVFKNPHNAMLYVIYPDVLFV